MAGQRAWYEFCVIYQRQPAELRKKVYRGRSTRAALMQIAQLPRRYGTTLDEHRAPLRCYQFIASVPDSPMLSRLVAQSSRFEALLAFFHEHGRWPQAHEILRLRKRIHEPPADNAGTTETGAAPPLNEADAAYVIALGLRAQHPEIAAVLRLYSEHPEIAQFLHSVAAQHGYLPGPASSSTSSPSSSPRPGRCPP